VTTVSPLELLHPEGQVDRLLVLGEGCPPALLPAAETGATADADLVLIAPGPAELGKRRWLERAAADAGRAVSADGYVYALVPPRRRAAAARLLRRAGLVGGAAIAQLPSGGAPRYLLSLDRTPWRHTLGRQIGERPRSRRALVAARGLPFGAAVLSRVLPTAAIVARRPGAAPFAAWVERLGGETRPTAHAVVATSWRGPEGATVVHCFAAGEAEPWGVAKVAPGSATEAGLLGQLGAAARAAGAAVPRPLASGRVGGTPVLVETIVTGRPAAELLRRWPGRFPEVAGAVSTWLERWSAATRASGSALEQELLQPAAALRDALPDRYEGWLESRCTALAGSEPPLVARHNDLTMWNVLVGERGAIGVIDWAQAEPAGLPLTDFFYAVADAAYAADGSRSRLEAVRGCFRPDGARSPAVAPLRARLSASLELSPDAVELCFHACWLRHALNEQRSPGGSNGEFLEVVRWLADRALEAG
jgi:hypothetical protein